MMRALVLCAVCLVSFVGGTLPATAGGAKVALVMGNARYGAGNALANAGNDARLMARTLASLGFAVVEAYDLDRDRLTRTVADFTARIPAGATAFVYYAGHGMQIGGASYLTPVDMPVTGEHGARLRAYPLKNMLERLSQARSTVNIVVLDACRNNPFQPLGAVRYRSLRNLGLSRIQAPRGSFIAYSTSPGQLAADGKGPNSLYTATLAQALQGSDQELEIIFRKVGQEVRRKTLDDQIPWYESSLAGAVHVGKHAAPNVAPDVASVGSREPSGSRGLGAHDVSRQWYRQMSADEWQQVDWEIRQRVRHLTPDEIPALVHVASGGSVLAQTVLGIALRDGVDRVRLADGGSATRLRANNTAGWRWLRRAAQAGFPVAQAEIGEMYYRAHGTARDVRESRRWLEQAAIANYPRARLDLAQLALESGGEGAAQDAARSLLEILRAPPGAPAAR
ncbi:caspase family protein [Massilia sp. BSC265]|uniref:caspase family protein n=1 Tax=Massilia sp. BSC265 TaxID=1549812 RepID=UPI0009DF2314|nr:caspase family protein [Massilia sp. BSC265]